jgi:hypothetical protein
MINVMRLKSRVLLKVDEEELRKIIIKNQMWGEKSKAEKKEKYKILYILISFVKCFDNFTMP